MIVPLYASNDLVNDSVFVDGNIAKNLAMRNVGADTTTVWGVLRDDAGNPITDPVPTVGLAHTTATGWGRLIRPWVSGSDGKYRIPLKKAGTTQYYAYVVSAGIAEQFYGSNMNPKANQSTGVGPAPSQKEMNIKTYRPNSTISGHIYKDGPPYDKCRLNAVSGDSCGDNFTRSFSDGRYSIPVTTISSGYTVKPVNLPQGCRSVPPERIVSAGATGVDFNVIAVEETHEQGKLSLTVYPNPFIGGTVLKLLGTKGASNLLIYNIAGKYVAEIEPEIRDGITQFTISKGLPIGIYFYSLRTETKIFKGKLVRL
jgi:hypothetical protein